MGASMVATWLLAALGSGVACGLLGVYLVGLELSFLGIAMAHAALAGAVVAHFLHLPVELTAGAASWAVGLALARLAYSSARSSLGALSSIFLSLSMGIAFLGIGMAQGEATMLQGLLWGNILFVRPWQAGALLLIALAVAVFIALSGRLLDALIFARRNEAQPFDPRYVMVAFMTLASLTITLNINFVGGLLIYALLTNPAAAAYEFAENMTALRLWSMLLGVLATCGGLAISWWFDLPTGACVVILSALIYSLALLPRLRSQRCPVRSASQS
ncbi:MAG: metal ABC transporter permease [Candidatus Sumerlaeaceae bacterium]|nr:metal ABC transporter permease [Candidatus Sumerlaeaceae bacterium]